MPDQAKTCFVVGPIGDADSDVRVHADWLLEEIILPTFFDFPDFKVVRADQISQPGMIDAQIIGHLMDADLVIADLSTLNPNAFYEIGIRHMVQKPIIHVQLAQDKIPFDVSLYRAIKFSRTRPADLRRAREDLKVAVEAVIAHDYRVDNPVTRARGQIRIEEQATPEQKVVLDQLRAIQERLELIEGEPDGFVRRPNRASSHTNLGAIIELNRTAVKNIADVRYRLVRLIQSRFPTAVIQKLEDSIRVELPKSAFDSIGWMQLENEIGQIKGVRSVYVEIPF